MISFPILRTVEVQGYELYPGTSEQPGLQAEFQSGVTLVIGANGLGKSTLIFMLYRLMAGTREIRGQGRDGLGSGQLELRSLRNDELRSFASRVGDGAASASATTVFTLGTSTIEVSRDIRSLALIALSLNGDALEPSEEEYERAILDSSGLSTFLDWMLILRYLVFYFDDRRSLVWDPSAQRRLLRLLFLPSNQTEPDSELVARILKQDSYYRNVSATLTRQESELTRQERALAALPKVEQELGTLTTHLSEVQRELESLQGSYAHLEDRRAQARLAALVSSSNLQQKVAELERLRLEQIRQTFPSQNETAAYLLTQILVDETCAVCGHDVPDVAAELRQRITDSRCPVCNSQTDPSEATELTNARLEVARNDVSEFQSAAALATEDRESAERELRTSLLRIAELEQAATETSSAIESLERNLPETNREVASRREALATLRRENALVRQQVLDDKQRYAELVAAENLVIAEFQQSVKDNFDEHARDFLLETCSLVWSQVHEQVGQVGQPISFSVFQVDMTGGAVGNATRRQSANQVSESQREFIDLAFRMALITVAGAERAGTLVIDAPESSLDAVFAPRAARVLTQFGTAQGDSRVILTSNLVDGQLIPTIAALAGIPDENDPRVVNLFEIAAPTAAIRALRADYAAALRRAFEPPDKHDE